MDNSWESEYEEAQEALNDHYAGYFLPPTTDAIGRYARLRDQMGEWQFYECKKGIEDESDVHSILKVFQEIEDIRLHELVQNKNDRKKIIKEAQKRVINGTLKDETDKQKRLVLVCLLHEEKWFDVYPLPDEAFEFEDFPNGVNMIWEVYGKYFRFYEYLRALISNLAPQFLVDTNNSAQNIPAVARKIESLQDIFHDGHKNKIDIIIERLSQELPIEITKIFSELDDPFISRIDTDIVWNPAIKNAGSYLAGIFYYCMKKYWLDTCTTDEWRAAFANTFNVRINTTTSFKKALAGTLATKYTEPFKILFKDIK